MTRISSRSRAPAILSLCGRRCSVSARPASGGVDHRRPFGFVDAALEEQGLARRVALTVPDFASALAAVAETDLIAAMPRRFVAMHAARFAVVSRELPLPLRAFSIQAVVPRVALMDAGLAWLFDALVEAVAGGASAKVKRRAPVRAAS